MLTLAPIDPEDAIVPPTKTLEALIYPAFDLIVPDEVI